VEKEPQVPTEWGAGWAPEPISNTLEKIIIPCPYWKSDSLTAHPVVTILTELSCFIHYKQHLVYVYCSLCLPNINCFGHFSIA